MAEARAGDRLIVESEKVGQHVRKGEIVEVRTTGGVHYRVRWEDGHETTFFPGGGAVKIVAATHEAGS